MNRFKAILESIRNLVFLYIWLEIFAFAAFFFMNSTMWSYTTLEADRSKVIADNSEKQPDGVAGFTAYGRFTLHPYLGFTIDVNDVTKKDPLMTKYGFLAESDPIAASPDPNIAIVALTGGSASEMFFLDADARKTLHGYLDKLPQFAGKKVILCMLGMGGYAQPQELISLVYYLYQGGRLDMMIHLDGHNEADYPLHNTRDLHIYPAYPAFWPLFFASRVDARSQASLGDVIMWRHLRFESANIYGYTHYSVLAGMVWKQMDGWFALKSSEAEKVMSAIAAEKNPYFIKGPDELDNATPATMTDYALKSWVAGSTLMYNMAQDNHFSYFHFLQPSPHLPGSKPLNEQEFKMVSVTTIYDGVIQAAYPVFIAKIPELNKKGIHTYSLADVFKDVKDTIYIDGCCHVNAKGNQMMADSMGKSITDAVSKDAANAKH